MPVERKIEKLQPEETLLIVIDVQERLLPVMAEQAELLENLLKLIQGIQVLRIPILVTEQYPKGLGPTIRELRELITPFTAIEKRSFSCCGIDSFQQALERSGRRQLLVCGIEAHVCVYQTSLDLLVEEYSVHVLTDGVSSRRLSNKTLALEKLAHLGAQLTSVEMALFELLQNAEGDAFKRISAIVK
jgi:nicotinamidase-related amidase